MPTQIETILAPRGGLNFSQPADLISVMEMSDGQNVFFEEGLVKKRYGFRKMGINLPLSGAIMGSDQYYKFAPGQSFLLVMTTKDIYRWDTSNKAWVQITSSVDLDDCESGWSAGSGDNVTHYTERVRGSYAVRVVLAAERSDGDLLMYKDISSTDIKEHNSIGFWIKSSTDLAANALEVVVSEDDHATGEKSGVLGTDYIECLTTKLVANTWTFVRLAKTLTNFDAVISVSLFANATLPSELLIRLDDIRAYTPFTGTDKDIFSYDYIRKLTEDEPWWVCTNGVDAIKKWDGSDYSVDDLGGSPPKAKRLVGFKDHLHLMDVTEASGRFPQRDRWCDTGDPENWSTGNASYKDLPGADWISNGMRFKGDYLVVFKERSIEVGWATGDSEIFEFDCKVTGAGCAAPNTIESLGDEIIFLGWDDVYVFNGVDYEPIGTKIQRELFRTLNSEQIGRSFGVIIEEQKEYWLFVTSTLSTYPDMAWCFNYHLNVWTKHSFTDYITMYGYYFLEAAMTWDDLTGSWQQQTFRWDDRTILSYAPTTLFGDKDGYVYEYDKLTNNDDDTAIDAYFDTKDFVRRDASGRVIRHRVLGIDVYYKGPSLKVYYSTDRGVTWNLVSTLAKSTSFTRTPVYLRIDSEFSRFRFRNAESNEHFEFERAELRWQYAGRKL